MVTIKNLHGEISKFKEREGRYPKIFLSGAISKRLDTYKPYFDGVEMELKETYRGISVYNPAYMPADTPWKQAMVETLGALKGYDLVFVLEDWEGSAGVVLELALAKEYGLPIIYQ